MENPTGWLDLIRTKASRRACLIVMTVYSMQRLAGVVPSLPYISTTLPSNGGGFGPEEYVMIFMTLTLVITMCSGTLMDRFGRRPMLIISGVSCAVLQFANAIFYHIRSNSPEEASKAQWIPYASLLLIAVANSIGIFTIPHTLFGEMFPINVKSKATAATMILASFFSFLISKIFPHVCDSYGPQYMFLFFAIIDLLCAVFTYFFVIETKGRSLPDIQNLLIKT